MKNRKVFNIIVNILRFTLVIAAGMAVFLQSWITLLVSLVTLVLSFSPTWFEKIYKIDLPLDFELAIIVFIYATLFLGEVSSFYERFWWWDILLHAISAEAFGCIGFIIMYILFKSNKLKANPIWLSVFAFCFAMTIGALWEIFEFGMDQIFGMNMQKSGLIDTMWDLIVDAIGALSAAIAGYAYMKGSQRSYLSRLINLFIKQNPNLKI